MSLEDVRLRRAIRRAGGAMQQHGRRYRTHMHKGKVTAIGDDGSVDILIPPSPDPGDGTGDAYVGVHVLGSYTPTVGDNVVFTETGPARFFCLGKSLGTTNQGGSDLPQTPLPTRKDQVAVTIKAGLVKSLPWFSRYDSLLKIVAWHLAVVDVQPSEIDVTLISDGAPIVATLPPFAASAVGFVDPGVSFGQIYASIPAAVPGTDVLVLMDVEYNS